ncbi:MAG: hypothetical protein J6D28_04175 [Bacilli bacterium]|nr:hypothetical protein [Bacilli bacterium]
MADLEQKKKVKVVEYNKLYYLKLKVSFLKKRIIKFLKTYFKLPHIWILFIILILSFIFLIVSIYYYKNNDLIFSLCSNMFAGLITGLVISLISSIKEVSLYITNSKIMFLKDVHNQCLSFVKESRKIYFSKNNDFSSEEEMYDRIYDLLCLGNDVSVSISQSQFNETIAFNAYKFFKKEFKYDSIEYEKINSKLRDQIMEIDVSTLSYKEIRELFKNMDNSIMELNSKVLNKIKELEIKIKATSLT